jgi:dipeptidyl aminopeptidase/acylaminoacyl peptidase
MNIVLSAFLAFMSIPGCPVTKSPPIHEIVKFENAGISLEGTLTLPGTPGRYPLAVFIHGSGRATRSDYEEFVTSLLNEGIAIFRYDKRGVGASGGAYSEVGAGNSEQVFSILASDAAAAISYFKNDNRITADRIILIGGSQAGWIIPIINAMTKVWLSVCFSCPAVTVGEEIYYSGFAENGLYSQEEANQLLKSFKGIRGFNPVDKIEKMESPSLWVLGGRDVSIPIKRTIYLLDSIKTLRLIPLEVKLYPGADHGLYNRVTQKREDYVNEILRWIRRSHR